MKALLLLALAGCGAGAARPTIPDDDRVAPPDPAAAGSEVAGAESLGFAAADGVRIEGSYWAPAHGETGCAIFVHQLSSTRAEYAPVIARLVGRGHLYAIDMRGHGTSTQGPAGPVIWQSFELADWEAAADDVLRAVDAVKAKGAAEDCVLIGASIGSSEVVLAAARAPDHTRGVVLLSPGLAYRGVKTPDAARAIRAPVLLVHSQEPGAVDAAGALAGIWRDARPPVSVEVIADPGTAHGMKIVAGDAATLDRVVGFIGDLLAR